MPIPEPTTYTPERNVTVTAATKYWHDLNATVTTRSNAILRLMIEQNEAGVDRVSEIDKIWREYTWKY